MSTIAIIDYGMGNLHSIAKALEHVAGKERVIVTGEHRKILEADRVVLPGVGAIRDCMAELESSGLDVVVKQTARERPLLGVCLGMQAMLDHSEENQGTNCLGLVPGNVLHFTESAMDVDESDRLKIPHMGWNQVKQQHGQAMWEDIPDNSRFYFVHSYYVKTSREEDVAATTQYGIEFASVLIHENIFAVQFHPEKSQHAGLQLLSNFVHWNGDS